MKLHFLMAALCVGTLTACSGDADPLSPSAVTEAAAPADASSVADLEDARDRATAGFDAAAAGRLRGALQQVIAGVRSDAADRNRSIDAALGLLTELEASGGDAVAADADVIRMALEAHRQTD